MLAKILISLGVIVYLVLIPFLEINHSHVFNSEWPAHARLHEVWQLTTNMILGLLALWLAWFKESIRLAAAISMAVMGGVLIAHVIEDSYGGSLLSGNTSTTVFGLQLAAFVALCVVVLSIVATVMDIKREKRERTD